MKKLASKGLLMSALICGNVLWGGITVLANEVQEYELDTMVVTATRTAQENIKVPAQVNVITAEDIKKSVKDNDVRFLRLAFTDINGTSKAVEVPTSQLDKVLTNDIRFDGSSIDGFVAIDVLK